MEIEAIIFDLDGTVYHENHAISGAANFINQLAIPYLFLTNRGNRTGATIAKDLNAYAIACSENNILTSSQALAQYLNKGTKVYSIGEKGLEIAIREAGALLVDPSVEMPDVVAVSYDRDFTYKKLTHACQCIHAGAKFIATNEDRVITTMQGLIPEAGPLVAAVKTATGVSPKVFGKPHRSIMEEALRRLGSKADKTMIIGDNLDTDIKAGINAGMVSTLILTGVSTMDDLEKTTDQPTFVVNDYEELTSLFAIQVEKMQRC